MIRVFGYLNWYNKGKIMIEPNYPNNDQFKSQTYENCKEFYPEAQEILPNKRERHDYLGSPIRITVYKDSDHAHDLVTRRSVTGILLSINNTLVKWISKCWKTIETSTYGAELVAAKKAVELILEYQSILRLMGDNVEQTSLLLGDNKSIVSNTTVPSLILKKKHFALSYHNVSKIISYNVIRYTHIDSSQNYSDSLTKALNSQKFKSLVDPLLLGS